MARRPSVRWNEKAERWMAWVRFPDGSRRKVERVDKADAQRDLDRLLEQRAQSLDAGPRRVVSARTFLGYLRTNGRLLATERRSPAREPAPLRRDSLGAEEGRRGSPHRDRTGR